MSVRRLTSGPPVLDLGFRLASSLPWEPWIRGCGAKPPTSVCTIPFWGPVDVVDRQGSAG